jgi:hypothetical protein
MVHSDVLKTTPIRPHFIQDVAHKRPGKVRRPLGDPVAYPKPYPTFIPPPSTNLDNLSLDMDVILPQEAQAALDTNTLSFHAIGDTGGVHGDDVEKAISDAMDHQISSAGDTKLAPVAALLRYFSGYGIVALNKKSIKKVLNILEEASKKDVHAQVREKAQKAIKLINESQIDPARAEKDKLHTIKSITQSRFLYRQWRG